MRVTCSRFGVLPGWDCKPFKSTAAARRFETQNQDLVWLVKSGQRVGARGGSRPTTPEPSASPRLSAAATQSRMEPQTRIPRDAAGIQGWGRGKGAQPSGRSARQSELGASSATRGGRGFLQTGGRGRPWFARVFKCKREIDPAAALS